MRNHVLILAFLRKYRNQVEFYWTKASGVVPNRLAVMGPTIQILEKHYLRSA
jgi:hypothetical protein